MIIKVGKSFPPGRPDNPATDHSKTRADPGSQDTGPGRRVALQRWRAPHFAAWSGLRQVVA
jgi:hypothetical protein